MDVLEDSVPAKKRCLLKNENKMQLPQEFPNMTPRTMKMVPIVNEKIEGNRVNIENSPTSIKAFPQRSLEIPSTKHKLPLKLQKLRILAPDGRDLGEFNLELRKDNLLKKHKFIISKSHNFSETIEKPKFFSLHTHMPSRIFLQTQYPVCEKVSPVGKPNVKHIAKCNIINKRFRNDITEANKIKTLQEQCILPTCGMISHDQGAKINSQVCNNNNIDKELVLVNNENSKSLKYQTVNSNYQNVVNNVTNHVKSSLKVQEITTESNKSFSSTNLLFSKNCDSFPIISHNFTIKSNGNLKDYFKMPTCSKGKCIATIKKTKDGKIITSLAALNLTPNCKINKNSENNPNDKSIFNNRNKLLQDKPEVSKPEVFKSTQVHEKKLQKNVMTIIPSSENCSKDLSQNNLLDRLNVIKRVVDSVQDNKLRKLALQALADCRIGFEKYIPIQSPQKKKTVHNTQVQTTVFGLLNPEPFVSINKDVESVQKSHNNDSTPKDPHRIKEKNFNDFDIDNLINQICEENSVMKLNDTLSARNMKCIKIIEQLERDFECAKQYDQNGRLGIHNAVLSNNIYLVQRQLMVLTLRKENVDIQTRNGETSLELAIKHDVCREIVKVLLDAGAQPVLPKNVHDSALIIASKQTSPLLPMLISRVSNSKLLDQIDSEGCAALHYCSIYNNLQGINALLSAGVTIDLKDMKSGRTALFHATDNSHILVVQTLLRAGASINIPNFAGQMPLIEMKYFCKTLFKEET